MSRRRLPLNDGTNRSSGENGDSSRLASARRLLRGRGRFHVEADTARLAIYLLTKAMKKTETVPSLTVRPTYHQIRRRHSDPSSATVSATAATGGPSKMKIAAAATAAAASAAKAGGAARSEASHHRGAAATQPSRGAGARRHAAPRPSAPHPVLTSLKRVSSLRQMQLLRLVNTYFPNEAQLNRVRVTVAKQVSWRDVVIADRAGTKTEGITAP